VEGTYKSNKIKLNMVSSSSYAFAVSFESPKKWSVNGGFRKKSQMW
jgi:hypothetical protein